MVIFKILIGCFFLFLFLLFLEICKRYTNFHLRFTKKQQSKNKKQKQKQKKATKQYFEDDHMTICFTKD
jgi:cell division protein FtsB